MLLLLEKALKIFMAVTFSTAGSWEDRIATAKDLLLIVVEIKATSKVFIAHSFGKVNT